MPAEQIWDLVCGMMAVNARPVRPFSGSRARRRSHWPAVSGTAIDRYGFQHSSAAAKVAAAKVMALRSG
jgi:hypothetical protein